MTSSFLSWTGGHTEYGRFVQNFPHSGSIVHISCPKSYKKKSRVTQLSMQFYLPINSKLLISTVVFLNSAGYDILSAYK